MRPVKVDDPPGIAVRIRCVDCCRELDTPGKLLTMKTLLMLCRHIYDNDHELVIQARPAKEQP